MEIAHQVIPIWIDCWGTIDGLCPLLATWRCGRCTGGTGAPAVGYGPTVSDGHGFFTASDCYRHGFFTDCVRLLIATGTGLLLTASDYIGLAACSLLDIRTDHVGLDKHMDLDSLVWGSPLVSIAIRTSWMEAWINCLTSSANHTLIIFNESSFLNISLPSFEAPNCLNTGNEL